MFVAEEKFKTNIAEYLLYMWQVEDLIRGFHLNLEDIYFNVIQPAGLEPHKEKKLKNWYAQLIEKMRIQSLEEGGHLHELNEIVKELYMVHTSLLNIGDKNYEEFFFEAQPYISEFAEKSRYAGVNEVEICMNALYMKLLLRLQKKDITDETNTAFTIFTKMISYITREYHYLKSGKMNYFMN
ncbi:MAG TPA: DUF4924 family protein [Flavobacteriales bacterium]|nr:DUF4924 family protein [Flavobacteriales bacterium]